MGKALEKISQENKILLTKRKSDCIIDHVSPKILYYSKKEKVMYCDN